MNRRIVVLVMSFFMLDGIAAQNTYKFKDCDLSFSSPEEFIAVNDNPGYGVFKSQYIQVTMNLIRSFGVTDIENELKNYLPEKEYTINRMGKPFQTENMKGVFYYATRSGYDPKYAKGIIIKDGKTILVEIMFDVSETAKVQQLISSFYTCSNDQDLNSQLITEYAGNAEGQNPNTQNSQSKDENNDVTERHKIEQEGVLTPVEDEVKQKSAKHPEVDHPNLIKITQDQKKEFIDAHNKWRADVGVPPIVWSDDLANFAAEWAVKKGEEGCNMDHRPNNSYGENLFWSSGMEFSPQYAVDSWGSEIKDYHGEAVGATNSLVGHYTQVVWRTTTEVGCAAFRCGNEILVVCNYNPPGNWIGQHPY